jgi:hypothetical protein
MNALRSYVIPVKRKGKDGQESALEKTKERTQTGNAPSGASLKPFAPLRPFVPNTQISRPSSFHQQSISRPPSSYLPGTSRPTSGFPPGASLQPFAPVSHGSRPTSSYPQGDFRNSAYDEILDIKSDVMVNYLHQQQLEKLWTIGNPTEGVVLKKSRANYTCSPEILHKEVGGFFDMVAAMNVRVSSFPIPQFRNCFSDLLVCLNS